MSGWLSRLSLGALVGVISVGAGCASERDAVERVQPQAIPKTFFLGANFKDSKDDPEFYGRTMIIDAPYGAPGWGLFTNSLNVMSRLKWEVTESQLVGRITYERVEGTDGKGKEGARSREGQVAYVFPITTHFDIRRDYNAQTGEESNVIVENTTDRPWYDREFFRVDWSHNQITAYDLDTLAMIGLEGGVTYENMAFNVTDPSDPNAPVYDWANGYFDVTNKLFAKPEMLYFPEWGVTFPACMLPNAISGGQAPNGNCNSSEITVRHSFKRVVDTDYEPADIDGNRFQNFGAFYGERYGYSREYGMVDQKWHRFVQRYNIWEKSHTADVCSSDSQCAVSTGSHCDVFNGKCTIPYQQRKEKPIYWHYADGSNSMYFDATRDATLEWDTSMRIAVRTAKYAECRAVGGANCPEVTTGEFAEEEDAMYLVKEVDACRRGLVSQWNGKCDAMADDLGAKRKYSNAVVTIAKDQPMVTLCHSPVANEDPAGCGKKGTVARLGDLRFHLVTSVEGAATGSPWGIMTDSNDPVTGEKVSASINVWTHVNDLWAQGITDVMRYIAGEIPLSDITEGKYVKDWVEAARVASTSASIFPQVSKDEIKKRVAALMRVDEKEVDLDKPVDANVSEQVRKLGNRIRNVQAADVTSSNTPLALARMNMAKGTPVEAALMTRPMQELGKSSPFYGNDPTGASSVLRNLNPMVQKELRRRKENALAKRGMCVMEFEATAPLGYAELSTVFQAKFGSFNKDDSKEVQRDRALKMKDYLRRRAQYAVISHEMGHSFALRHNFVSSSDPYNYRPQYWQLRTDDKKVTTKCTTASDGKDCVGPRYFDAVTSNESKNLIHMWAASSTMEYAGEPTQDMLGLGAYDFAATRAFYGDVATVYNDPEQHFRQGQRAGVTARNHQATFGGILGMDFDFAGQTIHYSELDSKINLIRDCENVDEKAFKPVNWNDALDGAWHATLDGHIVTNSTGAYSRCKQQPVDYVQFNSLTPTLAQATGSYNENTGQQDQPFIQDGEGRIRVPYGFATDDWADLGNLSVYRHDNGADMYELFHFWIAQQEVSHIFVNYRRGRQDFSVYGAFNRYLERYHEKMRDAAKGLGLFVNIARDTLAGYGVAAGVYQWYPSNVLGASIGFDHFTRVFAKPQAGDHYLDTDSDVLRSKDATGFTTTPGAAMTMFNGVSGKYGQISIGGRLLENQLSQNNGDYDRDYTTNAGSYYEKAFVSYLFTESADNFISSSRDDFYDPRFRSTSMADVFPDAFRRWLGNSLTGDEALKGPRIKANANGRPQVGADLYPTDGVGWVSWWPKNGPEVCFPGSESLICSDPTKTTSGGFVGKTVAVDSQVGWEQQKFAIAMTLIFLPENQRQEWIDQLRIFELGTESDPGFENRIEFHDPEGRVYIAKTLGQETIFGKTVQQGVGARVLEWANVLLNQAYETTSVTKNGTTWYMPKLGTDGRAILKGGAKTCSESSSCLQLQGYVSLPSFIRQAMAAFGYIQLGLKGVY